MSTTQTWLLDQLKNQGPSFVLMGIIVWFLYSEMTLQKQDIKQLQQEIMNCNKSNQDLLLNHLKENTRMLEIYEFNHGSKSNRRRIAPLTIPENE